MRFLTPLLLVLSAFGISSVFARMNHVNTRSGTHPSIARRQHKLPRLLSDTCVQVEASVIISAMVDLVDSLLLDLDLDLDLFAKADVCLCISSISLFIKTDVRIQAMVEHVGQEKVELMLEAIINESRKGQKCHFPEHGVARPSREHDCDCCDFTCEHTWERKGDKCVCPHPKFECHGKCVEHCVSPAPRPRGEEDHIEIEIHEIITYDQARKTCDPYDTVCGKKTHPNYDCCDVLNNKRNCGGCVWPHPFDGPDSPRGRDCESMHHKKNTWCEGGKCKVKECEDGWKPNHDFTECIEIKVDLRLDLDL